jgi:spermidine/putrescine-binding protein
MKRFRLAALAIAVGLLATLALAATGYGRSAHPAAKSAGNIEVFSLWGGSEQDAFLKVTAAFTQATGINVTYTAGRDFITEITARLAAGNPPDIAIVPRPGYLASLVKEGVLKDHACRRLGFGRNEVPDLSLRVRGFIDQALNGELRNKAHSDDSGHGNVAEP